MIECANPKLWKERPFDCPDFCEVDGHPARMEDCMLRERGNYGNDKPTTDKS
jgi:hypothetical protein